MRAVFLGTPAAAVPALAALANAIDVDVVVTRPDAPVGRSGKPRPPAVKLAALEWGLTVLQPESRAGLGSTLAEVDADVGVVVAYGELLEAPVLATKRFGYLNLHFSLLPRWRGPAPVERAILAGDEITGVSLMLIDEGLDTGPLVAVAETDIEPDETAGRLTQRLSYIGADLLESTLEEYLLGSRRPAPQIEAGVSHAPLLTTAEAQLGPDMDPDEFARAVRAFNPRPGAWLERGGSRLKIWEAAGSVEGPPAGVVDLEAGVPTLGVAGGGVALIVVQPAGRKRMSGRDWWNGLSSADRFAAVAERPIKV